MASVLLTGMSGTGKTSVIKELRVTGYNAVDLDSDEWSHWVDVDGNPTGCHAGKDWVWRDVDVERLIADHARKSLFVSGCSANMGAFLPLFDRVVLLSAPAEVILSRLQSRTGSDYGRKPEEIAAVLSNIAEIEPILRNVAQHEIDTRAPLHQVVAEVLRVTGFRISDHHARP